MALLTNLGSAEERGGTTLAKIKKENLSINRSIISVNTTHSSQHHFTFSNSWYFIILCTGFISKSVS